MKNMVLSSWFLLAAASLRADTMILQWNDPAAGYQGSVDGIAGIDEWQGWKILVIGTSHMGMLVFNDDAGLGIGTIGANYKIDNATLTLDTDATSPSGTLYLAPITSPWTAGFNETTPTYNAMSAIETAMPADTSSPFDIDITDFVKAWHADMNTNLGVIMYSDGNRYDYKTANSGYSGVNSPMLTINYSIIPEPFTWPLLLCGVIILAVARWRGSISHRLPI
jgi:hypothetical protein